MLIRQTLNFAAHFAAGIAMGALAVVAAKTMRDEEVPAPAKLSSNSTSTEKTPSEA